MSACPPVLLLGLDVRGVQASTFAPAIDRALGIVAWLLVFLSVVTAGCLLLAALAPRGATPRPSGWFARGRRLAWIAGGSVLALAAFLFVQGASAWADMTTIPRGAFPILVTPGEKGLSFRYPNGYTTAELHLPVDRPVKLAFQAQSEPYGFQVSAFRLQVAIEPFTDRAAWVQATRAGEYEARSIVRPVASAVDLTASVVVQAEPEFDKWYQEVSGPPLDLPPLELGARSYQMRGCTQCHTIDGTKLVGPSFKGFLARERKLADGTVVEPTDAYITESILDPQKKVLQGFEPVMPSFKGRLSDIEVAGLVAYVKSLP